MIMRCLSPSPGTPQGRASLGTRTADATGGRACECRPASTLSLRGGSKAPGISPSPPADDSYEDAETLGPGRCGGSGGADTDSSHYESYGEDEDGVTDRAHYLRRPPATGPDPEPPGPPEAQLCGFLWRKRWLGQWAKQLFIVREHVLLCFRCAADPQPVLELDLRGCHVAYKAKRGKKMPHALKVTGTAGEELVIGFQSRQQAEDWRKVIEEVSSDAPSGLAAISVPVSPSSRLGRAAGSQLGKEEEEEGSRQSPARSPRPGEDAKGGFLAVRLRGRWQRLWCAVRQGALRMFPEPGAAQRPVCALRLDGCDVSPGGATGSPQRLRIRIAQRGRELALLQTRSDEEREAWLKTLRARGGGEPAGDTPHTETPRLGDASSCPGAGGLLLRRVPTPNAYMDDPFGQPPPAEAPKHLYSNVERLQQLQQSLDRAVQGQRKRPVSVLPTAACSSAPGSALPSQAAPAALRGRAASPQQVKVTPELRSRDLSRSQRTLTLPERKGARDGLDILLGLVPHAAVEAHGVGKERPETLPGPHREGKSAAEEKGVGDEVCDVTSATAAPTPQTFLPARASLSRTWGCTWIVQGPPRIRWFNHQYQRYNYAHLFFIYIYIHINSACGFLIPPRCLLAPPSTLVLGPDFPVATSRATSVGLVEPVHWQPPPVPPRPGDTRSGGVWNHPKPRCWGGGCLGHLIAPSLESAGPGLGPGLLSSGCVCQGLFLIVETFIYFFLRIIYI
uniref:PH domain-containing protein n=1 Tax=Otus sunia TaxID=257818 RepID=A0A8C8AI16_9STRI